jgi:hypothetical protein
VVRGFELELLNMDWRCLLLKNIFSPDLLCVTPSAYASVPPAADKSAA